MVVFLWVVFMSDILSRVQILLDANTARFEQSMRNAQTTASNTFGKIIDGAKKMGPIVATGGAIASAAIIAMTNDYINSANEVTKFAAISDSTTTEFQKMAVGASTLGIESEQLASIYKDFNEKLGEFTTLGSGGALDFFEKIAIKTEGSADGARKLALEMQNLSGPQALQLYVDKAEEAGVKSEQMSFYLESMASDTTNLLPLLSNGGEGFKFWADAAEKAGTIMDESTIKKAGELRVQMLLLDLQVKGIKNQFIQSFIPSLNSVGGAFSDASVKTDLFSDAGETLGNVLSGVAAIALGVYASVKLVTNAVAGLAVDAVNAKKIVDSASDAGTWADRLPGIKLAKTAIFGATLAKAETSATSMAVEDNSKLLADVDTMITGLFDRTTSAAVKAMAEARNGMQGLNDGSQEWVDKQNEAAKAASKHAKAQKDVNKSLEEQARLRESLSYEFADKTDQMKLDYEKKISDIGKAGFASDHQSEFLTVAKNRYEAEKDLFLSKLAFELAEYKLTEDEKLNFQHQLDLKEVKNRTDLSDSSRKLFIKHAQSRHQHEIEWLRLEQAERLNNAQQAFQTEIQKMTSKYEFEREQIRLNKSLSADDKDGLIGASMRTQDLENDDRRQQAWSDFQNVAGVDTSAEDKKSDRNSVFEDALEWQLITQEEYQQRLLQSEQQYHIDRANLTIDSYSGSLDATTGFFKAMLGESSSTYQALFMAQKMFALSQAGMNIYKAASDAFANEPGTVWQKMGAAAMATLEGGTFVAMIEAATPIAHGGLDYVPEETTYLLDEGERVLSPRQNSDLTNYLANSENSKGGGDVNIHVQVTDSGVTAQSNQEDQKQLGQMIGNAVRAVIMQEKRQGGLLSK